MELMPKAGGQALLDNVSPQRAAALSSPAALARYLTAGEPRPELRWRKARHLAYINRSLVDLIHGRCDRLMIFAPPRHGKSQLCSRWLPINFLELYPHLNVILTAYAADFARSWGVAVRDTIIQHANFLQTRLNPDSKAGDLWHTTEGGGMLTAGVGGGIVGRGANLLVLDDPIKNTEEAFSPAYREKVWTWWEGVASRRLEPGGRALLTMQRWHDDDLAGRILKSEAAGRWRVLNLPALAEGPMPDPVSGVLIAPQPDPLGRVPGQALWPERYDEAALGLSEIEAGPYFWAAQYQQRPPSLQDLAAYYTYLEARNVKEVELRDGFPLQLSLDFNRRPGMVGIIGQHFRDDDLAIARMEFHRRGMTIERLVGRHAPHLPAPPGSLLAFLEWVDAYDGKTQQWTGVYSRLEIFGDATGRKTNETDGKSNWDYVLRELAAANIPVKKRVPKENPGVADRVNAVNASFVEPRTGRPRYLIHPACLKLRHDFTNVRSDDLDVIDKEDKEITHWSDAEGYRIAYLLGVRRRRLTGGRIGGGKLTPAS